MIRAFLIALATAFVAFLVLAGVAFNHGFQTWALRRVFAARPGLHASIGSVAVGLSGVELRDLRIERRGAVLTLPHLEAELPLVSALKHKLFFHRLAAAGWTLDLTKVEPGLLSATASAKAERRPFAFIPAAAAADAAAAPVSAEVFQGILNQLKLPVDLALDGLELEGDITLPPAGGHAVGRAHVTLSGGGLAAGGEGRFTFDAVFAPATAAAPVNSIAADGTLTAAMDGPRTFSRLAIRMQATATGAKFPHGVQISTDIGAVRTPAGENYLLTLAGGDKRLAALQVNFPNDGRRLAGTWKLDVRDDDVAPFALGRALPVFDLVGGGSFEMDAAFAEVHASGDLNAMVDRLAVLRPELSGISAVRLTTAFDLTRRGSTLRVDHLSATLAGSQPILAVRGLQAFAFNAATGELTVADASHDLVGIVLQGVPLEWAQPFLHGVVVTEGAVQGGLVVRAREGGISLRSTSPLTVASLSATRAGQPLFQGLGVSLTTSAAYTPLGWEAETKGQALSPDMRAGSQDRIPLLTFEAKYGRLAGKNQPIKAAVRLAAELPEVLRALRPSGAPDALAGGNFTCDFTASLAENRSIEAKLGLSGLAVEMRDGDSNSSIQSLPSFAADVRADLGPDGNIAFNAPVLVELDGRRSDLALAGTLAKAPGGVVLSGRITSEQLFADDMKVLALLLYPAKRNADGVDGQLTLALKSVVFPKYTATDLGGTLHLNPGALTFDGVRASLAHNGDVTASGGLSFDGKAGKPYALTADVSVANFDPSPVFLARNPGRLPPVEGKFNIVGRLSGSGRDPGDAAAHLLGSLVFTSKGGTLRVLSTDIASKSGSGGGVAAIGSFIGDVAGAVTGRKDTGHAIAELAREISTIPYDQMSVEFSRDASMNTVVKNIAVISPEMRLEGGGQATYRAGTPLLEQPLALELKLRARGRTADLLKFAGVLDSRPDDLGYFVCTLPLKIGGTLARPDTSELQMTLLNAAYEHSGAADLLNKLLGK